MLSVVLGDHGFHPFTPKEDLSVSVRRLGGLWPPLPRFRRHKACAPVILLVASYAHGLCPYFFAPLRCSRKSTALFAPSASPKHPHTFTTFPRSTPKAPPAGVRSVASTGVLFLSLLRTPPSCPVVSSGLGVGAAHRTGSWLCSGPKGMSRTKALFGAAVAGGDGGRRNSFQTRGGEEGDQNGGNLLLFLLLPEETRQTPSEAVCLPAVPAAFVGNARRK
ncbi:hypothetical protein KSP40_PGU008242 [Platanthera guangdongensis]|uniref:Transmembrane protein n=1 Tax=Platanthera guangdongensis TaxID=2320717 RepID=A0ABR2MC55_9ASPA